LVGELRRSQEQVLRADRLGTLGTLAAGLAHEINNPLVSIRTFLSLAPDKRHEDDPEFWNEYYEVATGEVERIRRLVASMESMSRAPAEEVPTELCDPSELAATIGRILGGEAEAAGVRFEVDCDVEAPKIICVRDHLHQVLLNLVLNAIQASAAGDRVVLRVFAEEGDDGPGLAIEVSDVGCGIAPADLESIFDPFFTRKGPDQGTGLGLTICQQIVTAHGGSIDVRSDEGQGTTFRVHLPCDPESA
jgi:signal transduction histidine kinase